MKGCPDCETREREEREAELAYLKAKLADDRFTARAMAIVWSLGAFGLAFLLLKFDYTLVAFWLQVVTYVSFVIIVVGACKFWRDVVKLRKNSLKESLR